MTTFRYTAPPPPKRPPKREYKRFYTRWWFKTGVVLMILGVVAAGSVLAFPKQILGGTAKALSNGPSASITEMAEGNMPSMSTLYDADGNVITTFYDQYRIPVSGGKISGHMRDAIVAIEDRRFYDHDGVDWFGVMRAVVKNAMAGSVEQGASTLTQQYVKNYNWLVTAQTEQEQAEAIAQTSSRKLTEITTAETLTEQVSKDEILTNYLNLVTFGNNTYGIEAASRTYFGIPAVQLSVPQSALLAGIVQAPSAFDPYVNPEDAKDRRNLVLDAMVTYGKITQAEADKYKMEPLGVLPEPAQPQKGCASAGNRGFFCAQAVADLEAQGVTEEDLNTKGLSIKTSLDPQTQDSLTTSLQAHVNPKEVGVSEVSAVIQPGTTSRFVKAMGSSRNYGYGDSETVLPLASSLVGNGAGSVFKVFTAAVALQQGLGTQTVLQVPANYEATGLGFGGNEGCTPGKYCVSNTGTYPAQMTLTDALAQSPNTPFVALAEKVGNSNIVDMAVKLGLRSYGHAAEGEATIADQMRGSGSFTLGVTPVNVLELSNVGATIASEGTWCAPQTITSIKDKDGKETVPKAQCESVLDPKVATNLAQALSQDVVRGTASAAAKSARWSGVMAGKTGTTDAHQSASFLGFTRGLSSAVYAINDGELTKGLCTAPLRQCDSGTVYGGNEPAQTWFGANIPIIGKYGGPGLNDATPDAAQGTAQADADNLVKNKNTADARAALEKAGYKVLGEQSDHNDTVPAGTVMGVIFQGQPMAKGSVLLSVSKGPAPRSAVLGGESSESSESDSSFNNRSWRPGQSNSSNSRSTSGGRSATL